MKYSEAIENGFRVINKNWQLVLIQIGGMFASFAGFFILVGIPLAIAFILFGLDLTELSRFEDIFRTLSQPSEVLSKYLALVVFVLTSLLFYITVVIALGVFVFGGSMGIIGRSVKDYAERFQMKTFLSEGKRFFFPLVGFTSLIGLIFIAVAFVLGLFGGAIAAIVSVAKEQEATLALFLAVFFSMIFFVIVLTLILTTLSVTLYGTAIMTMRGLGPVKSLKEAIRYLYKHADALYLYYVIFGGYFIINFVLWLLSYPIGFIPLVGSIMALVFKLAIYVVQSYLALVMIAVIFRYYYFSTEGVLTTAGSSSPETDISEPQVHGQGDLPHEKDARNEA